MTRQADTSADELRQLFREQGVPVWAIAQRYECSSSAIAHQMRSYGIEPPRRGRGKIPPEDTPWRAKSVRRETGTGDGCPEIPCRKRGRG